MLHTVEKIGGTSMSDYASVRDNIILKTGQLYQRIFVVSAYSGITNLLLENKHDGKPGIYGFFSNAAHDASWQEAFTHLRECIANINRQLFDSSLLRAKADQFIGTRLDQAEACLGGLQSLCRHGHFQLSSHLFTVREMLASIGEAHSAWNMVQLLRRDGVNARFVDLSGWSTDNLCDLDTGIRAAFADIDLARELPVVTGYAHCREGLMASFDRGYSEMTFSRIAVLTGAREAVIHKEYHLSSADPRLVGGDSAVPIGRTNYDVADQLANLGMEAIHPRAAKGMRQADIPLRIKNTFEPTHHGTLITRDYISETPRVEIIAGRRRLHAIEIFDQEMTGHSTSYDVAIINQLARFKAEIVSKDMNANTITHYVAANLKTVKRITEALQAQYPEAEISTRQVALVSAIGSDMKVPGMLAKTVCALAEADISILAMHQSMRQVDMQFVIDEADYDLAVRSLHACLVEVHNHGAAICAA